MASGTRQRALCRRGTEQSSPCSVLALTQLLLLWERLALTFKQLREQAVSLELPQEKLRSFLSPVLLRCSPRSRRWGLSGDSPQAAVWGAGDGPGRGTRRAAVARHPGGKPGTPSPQHLACVDDRRSNLTPGSRSRVLQGRISCTSAAGGEVSGQRRSLRAPAEGSSCVAAVSCCSHAGSLSSSPFQVGCLAELRSPVAPADCCPALVVWRVGWRGPGLLPHLCYVLALTHRPCGVGRPLLQQHVPSPACLRLDSSFGVKR